MPEKTLDLALHFIGRIAPALFIIVVLLVIILSIVAATIRRRLSSLPDESSSQHLQATERKVVEITELISNSTRREVQR